MKRIVTGDKRKAVNSKWSMVKGEGKEQVFSIHHLPFTIHSFLSRLLGASNERE